MKELNQSELEQVAGGLRVCSSKVIKIGPMRIRIPVCRNIPIRPFTPFRPF